MNCPYCGKPAQWVPSEKIYGKRYGKSYMRYWCEDCDAHVGCHNNTREPLGTMANKELRDWRMKAHNVVDPLWRSKKHGRGYVYAMLRDFVGRGVVIHIGESDIETCRLIACGFGKYMKENATERPKESACSTSR